MYQSKFVLRHTLLALIAVFAVMACKQSTESKESTQKEEPQKVQEKYTVTPFGPSQEYPDAHIDGMEYKDGKFTFTISGDAYKLGLQTPDAPARSCANSAEGQHIHLIIDTLPYAAKYVSTFDYDVPDGDHYILAFLSRSYHESIKSPGAAVAVKATVQNKSITEAKPVSGPMLFYSRPKGVYEGDDTKRVLLDYYLVNPNPDDHVKATINGEDHMLDTWQPYVIEGLPSGENTITLTLVDSSGNPVKTDLNPVTRKFVLNPTPSKY